jgi:hypothetical protein
VFRMNNNWKKEHMLLTLTSMLPFWVKYFILLVDRLSFYNLITNYRCYCLTVS